MMGLFDNISRNPYEPAKSISANDEECLVGILSNFASSRIALPNRTLIKAIQLNRIYHRELCAQQDNTTRTVTINSNSLNAPGASCIHLSGYKNSITPQFKHSPNLIASGVLQNSSPNYVNHHASLSITTIGTY